MFWSSSPTAKRVSLFVLVAQAPSRQCGDQLVLLETDVLVFVHQYPPEARQQPRAVLVRIFDRQPFAAQQRHCLPDYLAERVVVQIRASFEAGAHQPHGQSVAGEHGHPAGIVADQLLEAPPDLDRGVPVVGQGQNAAGILAP